MASAERTWKVGAQALGDDLTAEELLEVVAPWAAARSLVVESVSWKRDVDGSDVWTVRLQPGEAGKARIGYSLELVSHEISVRPVASAAGRP